METLITTVTDGQKKQVKRFAEDAVDRAITEGLLNKDGIQKLIKNGDEFQTHIITGIKELSVPDQYVSEEVLSNCTYPKEYKGPKPIEDQIKVIAKMFDLEPISALKYAKNLPALPEGAEGWFAIPEWQTLALTYGKAVEKVLAMIASKRKFYNYHDDQLGAEYLRQHAKTAKMFQKLEGEQKDNNILVAAAQFGLRHKGRSVRRAHEVFQANEFGLDTFAVGIMLLTHPEREVQWKQLHIDCAGDEFAPEADGDFSRAPIFYFNEDKVQFFAFRFDDAGKRYGSASAFIPQ